MDRLVELLTEFPTVVFTSLLAFCLAWWIVSLVVSGADGDFDADVDGDADLDVGNADGFHHSIGRALQLGTVPLSLACTVLAFGAWALSLMGQMVIDALDVTGVVLVLLGLVLIVAALAFGVVLLKAVAKPAARVFVTETAPGRHDSVGATCKVRSITETRQIVDAEVLTGRTKGSIIRVTAPAGQFARGDLALVVDVDERDVFTIHPLDPELHP